MNRKRLPNPLYTVLLAVMALLLLSAGMCGQAEAPPPEPTEAAAERAEAAERRAELEAAERELVAREAELAAEQERLAAEQERLTEEQERLRRQRQLEAEQQRLAAERAAAAERRRELAEREAELAAQEERLARREAEVAAAATVVVEQQPEPLPEPTGSYEGNYDEPWRQSQEGGDEVADAAPAPADTPAQRGRLVSVQAGEMLEVQLTDTLSSATAQAGDRFSARLVEDLRDASGTVVVPAGSKVRGRVTEASPYRRGGGPATLGIEFTDLVLSPEQTVGIRATFVELGADKGKNRRKVVAGAVAGAILGHILGGDGSKSVIVGAAAGAAAGGAMVARNKDRDAEIPAGQLLTLQLEEVVTVEIQYGAVAGR